MFLVLVLATLLQQPSPEGGGLFYSYVNGMRWTFNVRPDDVRRSPGWAESDDQPPLAPRAAVRSARALLRTYMERADEWRCQRVSLQPIGGKEDSWIYVVEFTPPIPTPPGSGGAVMGSILGSPLSVVVMLDGTAITPDRQPWRE